MRQKSFSEAAESAPAELTILSQGARFEGKSLRVAGDLRVDGEVQVEDLNVGERLIISPSGELNATRIRAHDAVIAGNATGRCEIESTLVLKETGHVSGVIVAARLIVEEGGVCDGTFSIGASKSADRSPTKELPFPGGMKIADAERE